MIHRTIIICAALAFGACASPILAQQSVSVPLGPPRPAPAAQIEPPPPPPLPPMPNARHRWVDVGNHHSAHASAKRTHHAAKVTKRSSVKSKRARHAAKVTKRTATRTHDARKKHEATQAHHAKSKGVNGATARPSSKTVRRCHKLSYSQIMRNSACRALMKQDLAAADRRTHRKAQRHKATKHKAAHAHKATRPHHATSKKRRK